MRKTSIRRAVATGAGMLGLVGAVMVPATGADAAQARPKDCSVKAEMFVFNNLLYARGEVVCKKVENHEVAVYLREYNLGSGVVKAKKYLENRKARTTQIWATYPCSKVKKNKGYVAHVYLYDNRILSYPIEVKDVKSKKVNGPC